VGTPSFQLFACVRWYTISPIKTVGRGEVASTLSPYLGEKDEQGSENATSGDSRDSDSIRFLLSMPHPGLEHTINFACGRAGRDGASSGRRLKGERKNIRARERQIVSNKFRRRLAEEDNPTLNPTCVIWELCTTTAVQYWNFKLCHYAFIEQPRPLL